jgi:hypothetical protein
MGFKPKDRVRLKVRGVKIRAMVSLRKQAERIKDATPKVRTINKPRGLRVHLNSSTNALQKKPA